MREFRLDLSKALHTSDEDCSIIFLKGVDDGIRLPFAVNNDELEDLRIAAEEGKGATPPLIGEMVREIDNSAFRLTQIIVEDIDIEDRFIAAAAFEGGRDVTLEACDLLEGIMLAIHYEVPIYVNELVIVAQEQHPNWASIVENLNMPDEEDE